MEAYSRTEKRNSIRVQLKDANKSKSFTLHNTTLEKAYKELMKYVKSQSKSDS